MAAFVKELYTTLQSSVFLCDTTKILSGNSSELNSIIGTAISGDLSYTIQKNKDFTGKTQIPHLEKDFYCCCCPIFADDIFGALIVFSNEPIPEWKQKTTQMVSRLIANGLNKFK